MNTSIPTTLHLLLALFSMLGVVVWLVIGIGLRITTTAALRFALGNVLLAAGVLLVAQRTEAPSYAFYPVGDLLVLLSMMIFRSGLQFLLRQPSAWLESATVLFGTALVYLTVVPGPESTRFYGVIFSLVTLYLSIRTFQVCVRGLFVEFGFLPTGFLSLPFVLMVLAMTVRLLHIVMFPQDAILALRMNSEQVVPWLWIFIGLLMMLNVSLMAASVGRLLISVRLLSECDSLTGLWNRRAMEDRIRTERARFGRGGAPYSIAIADLDHFKRLNDELGHAGGDAALQHAAAVLGNSMRTLDVLGRFGGEEFMVLMPMTSSRGATEAARRLQEALATTPFVWLGQERIVTASFGVAEAGGEGDDAAFKSADLALYRAKESGRNCVVCADPLPIRGRA